MHIKVQPLQLLWPTVAQGVITDALNYLAQDQRSSQPILVHGCVFATSFQIIVFCQSCGWSCINVLHRFSVGGYLYGEMQVKMANDPRYHPVGERIVGQVYDSPVGFKGIPTGVGKAVTPVPILQKTIKFTLERYLKLFKNQTTKHYLRYGVTWQLSIYYQYCHSCH